MVSLVVQLVFFLLIPVALLLKIAPTLSLPLLLLSITMVTLSILSVLPSIFLSGAYASGFYLFILLVNLFLFVPIGAISLYRYTKTTQSKNEKVPVKSKPIAENRSNKLRKLT